MILIARRRGRRGQSLSWSASTTLRLTWMRAIQNELQKPGTT